MKLGILIVGSLYWENDNRERWRDLRLSRDEQYPVAAPIRYGRESSTRGNTYTMVFSLACNHPAKIGQAKVIACQYDAQGFDELKVEAQWLWAAESKQTWLSTARNNDTPPDDAVSANGPHPWGCVGIIRLDGGAVPPDVIPRWTQFVSGRPLYAALLHAPEDGEPALGPDGVFRFRYTRSPQLPFDLLLATATQPTLIGNRYPNAQEIAQAWNEDCKSQGSPDKNDWNVRYFFRNRENDIRSFEDDAILSSLTMKWS
jgi:hypothetical protein